MTFSGDRVIKGKPPGMEHEPSGLLGGLARFSVNRIADERSSLVMEMDPDLMGAAGVQVAQDKGGDRCGVGGKDFVIRDGRFPTRWINDSHFLTIHRVTADVGKDGVLGGFWNALCYCQIELFHGTAL